LYYVTVKRQQALCLYDNLPSIYVSLLNRFYSISTRYLHRHLKCRESLNCEKESIMKMVKKVILVAVVLPITLGTASAFAGNKDSQNDKGHKSSSMEQCSPGLHLTPRLMKKLDLTDAQENQLKELRKADRAEMEAKMDEHAQHMNALLLADKFDKAQAITMVKEEQKDRIGRQVDRLEKDFNMLSVLTPAQKTKLLEIGKKYRQKCAKEMKPSMGKEHKEKGE